MRKLTISIAMATYNGGNFLEEQLYSLLKQNFLPYELIICDDGSTDKTIEILNRFAQSSPFPVKIIQNEFNLGYADNFLKAASLCKGDCIAFCDQDDIWDSKKLSIAANAFTDSRVTIFSHGCQLISASGDAIRDPESMMPDGCYYLANLDPLNAFFGFSCVFRRSLLSLWDSKKRPIDLINKNNLLAHDRWIYFLATITGLVVYDSRPLALYRQHANNLCGSEIFKKRNAKQLIKKVYYKYNEYIYKRREISHAMNCIVLDLSKRGILCDKESILEIYNDMFRFYDFRLNLFQKSRANAVIDVLKFKLLGFYDVSRRYSNSREFWQDIIAIFIARRM